MSNFCESCEQYKDDTQTYNDGTTLCEFCAENFEHKLTESQVLSDFRENILPSVVRAYGEDDSIAINEAFRCHIDNLHRDNLISNELVKSIDWE